MLSKTEFAAFPESVMIEHRIDTPISDIWIRNDIHTIQREEDTIYIADEAYMQLDTEDCPSVQEVEKAFDDWFELAKEWQSIKVPTIEELQAKIDYLEILVKERV